MKFLTLPIVFLSLMLLFGCQQEQPTVSPEYRQLTSAVYASGSIEPLNAYQVFAPASGILQEKLVEAGDNVEKDEALFMISQESASLELASARERLATAQRNAAENSPLIMDIRLSLEQAEERLQQDSLDYRRQQNLMEQNATSRSALEQARMAYLASRNKLQSARVNLEQTSEDLQDRLREVRIAYQLAAERQGNTVVKSRFGGKVYQTYIREGEMVTSNQPLAVLGDASSFYLELIVDERDISRVKIGMPVVFSSDILNDTILRAEVSKIYPFMNEEDRSLMNIPFVMADGYKELEADFLKFATDQGMVSIKGHRSVGGFRASLYNAMPIESVRALTACMQAFEANH